MMEYFKKLFFALWLFVDVLPHPSPLPLGEGITFGRVRKIQSGWVFSSSGLFIDLQTTNIEDRTLNIEWEHFANLVALGRAMVGMTYTGLLRLLTPALSSFSEERETKITSPVIRDRKDANRRLPKFWGAMREGALV